MMAMGADASKLVNQASAGAAALLFVIIITKIHQLIICMMNITANLRRRNSIITSTHHHKHARTWMPVTLLPTVAPAPNFFPRADAASCKR